MSNRKSNLLYNMVGNAIRDKNNQRNEKLLEALKDIREYEDIRASRVENVSFCHDFGIGYMLPERWTFFTSKEYNSKTYYAYNEGLKNRVPAAVEIVRRRGNYRGYENADRLERLAMSIVSDKEKYDFKYIKEVNISGRICMKAVCMDKKYLGKEYNREIYIFYKSKTEVIIFNFLSDDENYGYYKPIFDKILKSIVF